MSSAIEAIAVARREQVFPSLSLEEIERLRRFGEVCRHCTQELVVQAGRLSQRLYIILSGKVQIIPHGAPDQPIVTHGPGNFMGELAQLSGRPSLVDGLAAGDVEAIVIPPQRLRDLLVEEAEIGKRIMRALILRRVILLQGGVGGPIIVGRADNGDVLRLQSFLKRNAHPSHRLDPDDDVSAKTLIERFHLASDDLPIVLCLNGEILRNPTEVQLARCISLSSGVDASKVYDMAVVGAGPAGLAAAVYSASEGLSVVVLDRRSFGGQAGASARIENCLGFPTGISGVALTSRAYNQAQKFGADMAIPEDAITLRNSPETEHRFELDLASGGVVKALSVIITAGARYRRLNLSNLSEYEGSHAHYWASPLEGKLCSDQEVVLVGASYSTGQVQSVPGSYIGGFVGYLVGALSNDYWDTTTSGITNLGQGAGNTGNAPGVTGDTTAQLQSGLPGGFSGSIWGESANVNGGLPYLLANPPA